MALNKSQISFVYENNEQVSHYDLVNDLIDGFEKAKERLGIALNGHIDDIKFVEIPSNEFYIE